MQSKNWQHDLSRGIDCSKKELFKKEPVTILSPTDGIIENIDKQTGKIIIKISQPSRTIPSGFWGTVKSISKDEEKIKIQIESDTIKIKGVEGRGFVREGILQIASKRLESADP